MSQTFIVLITFNSYKRKENAKTSLTPSENMSKLNNRKTKEAKNL